MQGLRDKVCLVTGGANGIGKATTKALLEAGAKVFVLDVAPEKLEALKQESKGLPLETFRGDVSREEEVVEAFSRCRDHFGKLDVLINNAGLGIPTPDMSETALDVFDKMMDVNVKGVFLCSREALKMMKPQQSGHIVTLVSMAGQRTNPTAPVYCASKFGARGLSSGLADQILKEGIKVTDVNPGPVDSDYWGDRAVPREKFLSVEDVAGIILFVLSTPEHVVIRDINFDNIRWLSK